MQKKQNGKMSKAAFVRSQPSSMSVAEVVAAGKREGIDISPQNVHATRHAAKHNTHLNGSAPKTSSKTKKKKSKAPHVPKASPFVAKRPNMGRIRAVDGDELLAMEALARVFRPMIASIAREEIRACMQSAFLTHERATLAQ